MSSAGVVIPCYNYARFLPEAVGSVLNDQPGTDVRVLIIDDASQDDSADVARALAAADSRVDFIQHAANRGPIATFNEGIMEWADSEYTVLMSADDRLVPGALRRAAALMDANPGVGFVYGHPVRYQHGSPPPAPRTAVRGWSIWPGRWWIQRRFRDAVSCISSPEVMVRTSLQKQVGGYDPRLTHTGDLEMWLRLAAHADVGYIRGADQAFYRIHDHNLAKSATGLADLRQRRLAFEALLERHADKLPDAASLSNAVHRKLCWEALYSAVRAYDRGRTAQTPVDDLVAFAFDCWPKAARLRVYQGLRLRRRIGVRAMPYLQPLAVSAVGHTARSWWWWRSWARRGY
jgi:glycosyltransferase involved in cell wall biosynthesis